MKKNKFKKSFFRLFPAVAVLLCSLTSFCSCTSAQGQSYRNDLPCTSLTEKIIQNFTQTTEYSQYSKEELDFFLDLPEGLTDFSVVYSTDANDLNEFGVFKCENKEDAVRLLEEAQSYLAKQKEEQKAFVASYAPHEVPKLEDAEARRYGNYVVYTVLSLSEKNTTWQTVEKELKKG